MNSEFASEGDGGARVRRRLHSVTFLWLMRLFAVLLAWRAGTVLWAQLGGAVPTVTQSGSVWHAGAFLLFAGVLWHRARRVFAVPEGVELITGRKRRVIPWAEVGEIRELPLMWLHPPWYPRHFQLDLTRGESLEFFGRRKAHEILRAMRPRSTS